MGVDPLDRSLAPSLPRGGRSAADPLGLLRAAVARPIRAWRRRTWLARLRSAPPPREVLFLCQGNLYRSPYAAAVFQAALPAALRDSVRVASAGFMGSGRSVPTRVSTLAATRGFALGSHRSRLVSTEAIAAADLIVVMEPAIRKAVCKRFGKHASSVLILGDLDPRGTDPRAIADPALRSPERLAECFARIERCTTTLVYAIRSATAAVTPG